jgi:hypothetical protein
MKAAQILVVLVGITFLLGWVTRDYDIGHIARALPGCGGQKPMIFEFGAVAMLGLLVWGLSRLSSRPGKTDEAGDVDEVDYEPEEADGPAAEDNPEQQDT